MGLCWRQCGWAQAEGGPSLGPCPGQSRQAWLASSLALGKPSFPAGLAFKPRQRGAFSLASLFCRPRALLSAWQKLIPLCSWEPFSGVCRGLSPSCRCSPRPGSCPTASSLCVSGCLWPGGPQGSLRQGLRPGKGCLEETALRPGESAVAQGERRPAYSWDEGFGERVGGQVWKLGGGQDGVALSRGCGPSWSWNEGPPGRGLSREVCSSPAPSSCPPTSPRRHHNPRAARSSPGPV